MTVSLPRAGQQRLLLEETRVHERRNFIVSQTNAAALAALDAWPRWPGAKLALIGPSGSGKTHLARAWADETGARTVRAEDLGKAPLSTRGPLMIDNADRAADEARLVALLDEAQPGAPLLLTARTPPRAWKTTLPDLRSRLAALMVAELQSPDDVVLAALIEQLFRERHIAPGRGVVDFLLRRIERSAAAAREVVARMDERASLEQRSVTRELAREILGDDPPEAELFGPGGGG
ncbi:MAG TPA: chromosomal replication initiator DnaA [Caulobacteraceae bacterium]|nr:chromosomal replication initiator DnaA [Caulobacteraceae bacterium]